MVRTPPGDASHDVLSKKRKALWGRAEGLPLGTPVTAKPEPAPYGADAR